MDTVYDFFRINRPFVTFLALVAFLSLITALIAVPFGYGELSDERGVVSIVVSISLALVIIISLVLMIYTTGVVIKSRSKISSWGWYVALIWLFPYIAISVYLGGAEVLRLTNVGRSRN